MSGGIMQLVAYGAQDVYLTGDPQITYFKKNYKRHTNFSMESIEQTFNGTADFGKTVTCTVSRNADLITRTYLQVDIPSVTLTKTAVNGDNWVFSWVSEFGHFLIKSVEVEIGGQRIDKHYGTWLSIWSSLTLPTGKKDGYTSMIGGSLGGAQADGVTDEITATGGTVYVPLQFWFCREVGLALPLIALQYHEVKFNLEFAPLSSLYTLVATVGGLPSFATTPSLQSASLFIDYVYLDTQERQKFAQFPHEFLIEQLQFTGDESLSGTNNKVRLTFNHPCKELVWVVQDDNRVLSNFTDVDNGSGANPVSKAILQLNGHDRFKERSGSSATAK